MKIENPTFDELKTVKGIIYLIKNLKNGKCYIGKTKHRFTDRYHSGEWWKYTNNYLSNAVNLYGLESFKLELLETNVLNNVDLLKLETKYIHLYNSLAPNGYNFIEETGEVNREFTEEFKLNIALAGCKGKIYKIKEIETGIIKEFRCPKEIIDKYGVKQQNLHQLFAGKLRTLKGICLPETNTDKWSDNELKILVDQFNVKYEFYNVTKFERENNCSHVLNILSGKSIATKSKDGRIFRLETTKLDSKEYLRSKANNGSNRKYKTIILIRIKDNKEFNIDTTKLNEFCLEHHINKREIHALTGHEQKTTKGFKLKGVVYL